MVGAWIGAVFDGGFAVLSEQEVDDAGRGCSIFGPKSHPDTHPPGDQGASVTRSVASIRSLPSWMRDLSCARVAAS